MRRHRGGFSYVTVICSMAIATLMMTALLMMLTHGLRLSAWARARTELLNAAQAELERACGTPFDRLQSYAVSGPNAAGSVQVESLPSGGKRISVWLQHARNSNQTVVLVTEASRHGLHS